MADELRSTLNATFSKGNLKRSWNYGQEAIDVAGDNVYGPVTLSIGTSEETITFTDVTTLGTLYLKNLDATNYVTFGADSGGTMVGTGKLKPTEEAKLRLVPGITFKMQANTAACMVDVMMVED